MRAFFLALALTLSAVLFGASNASAAPVSGSAIAAATEVGSIVEEVQWRSRTRCRLVTRNVHRWRSRYRPRTVRVCRHR